MRITNNILSRNLLLNLGAAQGRMDKLQNQMATGQRINRPSDDPVGTENSLRFKSSISHVNQWKSNAKEGIAYLDTTDDTLGEMTEMIQRAKELTLRASNTGTVSDDDREKIAIEIEQIRNHVIELANTKVGTKYIFGGTANVEPFPKTDGVGQWMGSNDTMKFQVGSTLSIEVAANGQELFGVDGTDKSKVAMFDTLTKLSTALKDSDFNGAEGLQAMLGKLEEQADHIADVRAQLGARQNRMDSVYSQLDSTSANLADSLANVLFVDIAETLVDFKTQDSIYQAALSVGTKVIQPSLADFLR